MKLNIAGKEINIKYGYKPTLKARIISKSVKFSNIFDEHGNIDMEKFEDLMLFLPEMLLVGMQVHHKDYRYDYEKTVNIEIKETISDEVLEQEGE